MSVAVVGTGSAGLRHLEAIGRVSGTVGIAIPQRMGRAETLAAAGYRTASSVREAVGMGVAHCVIATGTGRHLQDGLLALEQGCHVLVEKPLAIDARQARRMCDQGEATGRQVFVGCVLRFSEALGVFRTWLPEVGSVHAVRIECRSYLPAWRPERPYQQSYSAQRDEGGVLRDLIHEIDYAGWLFGWPSAVQARLRNTGRLGIAAEEIAELWWDAPSGAAVSVSLDYLTQPARRRMSAYGERGTIVWDAVAGAVTLSKVGFSVRTMTSSQTVEDMLVVQADAFLCATAGAADPRLASGQDGVRALAVCDAAREASETTRQVAVSYQEVAA